MTELAREETDQRYIAVLVGQAVYGVAVDDVQEVIAPRPLTRVFHAPSSVAGVMSLRGDVLPVLELATLLHGSDGSAPDSRPTAHSADGDPPLANEAPTPASWVAHAPIPTRQTDDPASPGTEARIVVVREAAGKRRRAGLRVDALGGLRDLPAAGLAPVPTTILQPARDLVVGILTSAPPCAVISITALLDSPRITEFRT